MGGGAQCFRKSVRVHLISAAGVTAVSASPGGGGMYTGTVTNQINLSETSVDQLHLSRYKPIFK